MSRQQMNADDLLEQGFPMIEATLEPTDSLSFDDAHRVSGDIFRRLPKVIRSCLNALQTDREKKRLLFAVLPTISSIFATVRIRMERGTTIRPCLRCWWVPPEVARGWARRPCVSSMVLASYLSSLGPSAMREAAAGLEGTQQVHARDLLIAADASEAALYAQLAKNGGIGFMFTTEVDAFNSAATNKWGQLSHLLRGAFEHKALQSLRVTHKLSIEKPATAVLFIGTPGQVQRLFGSAERGLYSRYAPHLVAAGRGAGAQQRGQGPTTSTTSQPTTPASFLSPEGLA